MGNPNKDRDSGTTESTESTTVRDARDTHQAVHDLSQERDARDTTLAKQVVETIAREMAEAHAHYQALLNERGAAAMPTSLKMTSGPLGFKVMDPFDWTKDKAIYQRWQMRSEKLDMPLKQWKVIQKRLKFHISTTGLTVKEWPRFSHGRIARHSLVRRTMRNLSKIKKKASTL